ncbi:putative carbonic anhydrase 2 [Panonychus citri]|uniref:putative carbonic anhydrase 2 n=1 Tax=Panonychus citri TaxID=50023 RepID=UPI002307F1A2|nr:putative carbonic anhydrase 2 [Panonychus citri]XP_053206646.1 putative carbonic anhydrase 2 [Panonychus citri]XP_053206647.1 putative carbonic anhydrase 2 [Panonychus citri]XP_053206648.1 putative carbonic anhydrase 2 [Panonychus citri]XP_053206649.1 putative carbonic anhydrase 2 [Panonychus citri]XP_053206650.1 putative carbonic anhydrase 2 [Panonychus citri]XP_053206651.1 putative carbonic anhydrase 2 [Panonychus citri]XP_053206652.1 putative carbonic anhydrase 2 [Panonychus citri]
MEPILKRKVGSILEALEAAACSAFNMRDFDKEISAILVPTSAGLPSKENITTKKDEPVIIGDDFSFVRHKQESIPGLSIAQDEPQSFVKREGQVFNDFIGGHGASFNSRFRHDRGRGGLYRSRRDSEDEQKKSESREESVERGGIGFGGNRREGFDNEQRRFDNDSRRFDNESRRFEHRGDSSERGGRGFSGDVRRGNFDRGRGSNIGEQRRFEPRGGSVDRGVSGFGGGFGGRRGNFDRGRGSNIGEQRRFEPRGGSVDRGVSGFGGGFGGRRGNFDRGRGGNDNDFRRPRFEPRGGSAERGGNNNFNNRRGTGGNNRRMRRRKMTPQEEAEALARMNARDAAAERALMIAGGQLPPDS